MNLMQNWVKYLRVAARLSLMMGTFCLICMMTEVTYGLWSPTCSTLCHGICKDRQTDTLEVLHKYPTDRNSQMSHHCTIKKTVWEKEPSFLLNSKRHVFNPPCSWLWGLGHMQRPDPEPEAGCCWRSHCHTNRSIYCLRNTATCKHWQSADKLETHAVYMWPVDSYVLKVSISPVRLILSMRVLSTFSFSFSSSCGQNSTPRPLEKKNN